MFKNIQKCSSNYLTLSSQSFLPFHSLQAYMSRCPFLSLTLLQHSAESQDTFIFPWLWHPITDSTFLFLFWLHWVLVSVQAFSSLSEQDLLPATGPGFLLDTVLFFWSTGYRVLRFQGLQRVGSAVVTRRLSCSMPWGIFPDQGANPRPLYWLADSCPL